MRLPSMSTWCLLPGRPRSTGLGPVNSPFGARTWKESTAARDQSSWSAARSLPGGARGGGPTRRRRASHATCASHPIRRELTVEGERCASPGLQHSNLGGEAPDSLGGGALLRPVSRQHVENSPRAARSISRADSPVGGRPSPSWLLATVTSDQPAVGQSGLVRVHCPSRRQARGERQRQLQHQPSGRAPGCGATRIAIATATAGPASTTGAGTRCSAAARTSHPSTQHPRRATDTLCQRRREARLPRPSAARGRRRPRSHRRIATRRPGGSADRAGAGDPAFPLPPRSTLTSS